MYGSMKGTRQLLVLVGALSMLVACLLYSHLTSESGHPTVSVSPKDLPLKHNPSLQHVLEKPQIACNQSNSLVSTDKSSTAVTYNLCLRSSHVTYSLPLAHLDRPQPRFESLEAALKTRASSTKTIILSVIDLGYIDMAINLYVSSLLKLGLHNHIFVCAEKEACGILQDIGMVAVPFVDMNSGKKASNYASSAFRQKTHVKTMATLRALELGYSVLMMDVDIILFKNPFLNMNCSKCDIQITWDVIEGNSGFYLAHPTEISLKLHRDAMSMAHANPDLSNQKTLDRTMEKFDKMSVIKLKKLSENNFPNGYIYYEKGQRMWPHPCPNCIIVHNNWIVSGAAKIYRFKEHNHWFVDKNGYYSNMQNRYLVYDNPAHLADHAKAEYEALKSAFWIAHILNRTVILPTFHTNQQCSYEVCKGQKMCAFNTHYHVGTLDKYLGDKYREHNFLSSPLVPTDVKSSKSEPYIIDSSTANSNPYLKHAKATRLAPADPYRGASKEEIIAWFSPLNDVSVITFHSLYSAVDTVAFGEQAPGFQRKLDQALQGSDYRQYKVTDIKMFWLPARTGGGTLLLIAGLVFIIPFALIVVCYKTGCWEMEEVDRGYPRYRRMDRV